MLQPSLVETPVLAPLEAGFARSLEEVRQVQRLRFEVFARELGARVPGYERGLDCDPHDAHCTHLMVRDSANGQVVGTYKTADLLMMLPIANLNRRYVDRLLRHA